MQGKQNLTERFDLLAEEVRNVLNTELSDSVGAAAMGWEGGAAQIYERLIADLREDISAAAESIAVIPLLTGSRGEEWSITGKRL